MKYTRHYDDPAHTREERDAMALADAREYCTQKQWDTLQQCVGQVKCGHLTVQQLNMAFGFAGINGLPFHAFCREYCLAEYRDWMQQGRDGVITDEQGFPAEEETA